MKRTKLFLELFLSLGGLVLLILIDWRVALGIYLFTWGNNIMLGRNL